MEYMDETTLAHKHTSPWLIAFRIIFTIALVWCILFIFHNSLETSSISSARSHEVMQKINAILAHLNIGPLSEHVVRKLAHFSEFTLEGFLLMLCLRVYTRRFVRHVSWPMLSSNSRATNKPAITPPKSIHTSRTDEVRPGTYSWMVSSSSAVAMPPSMGQLTWRTKRRV